MDFLSLLNVFWVHSLYCRFSLTLVCRRTTKTHALNCLAPWFCNRKARGTVSPSKVLVTDLLYRASAQSCRWPGEFESPSTRNFRGWFTSISIFVFSCFFILLFSPNLLSSLEPLHKKFRFLKRLTLSLVLFIAHTQKQALLIRWREMAQYIFSFNRWIILDYRISALAVIE